MKNVFVFTFIVIAFLVFAPRAAAHAFVARCEPGVGGHVEDAPKQLRCTFTQQLVAHNILVVVTNETLERVDLDDARLDNQDSTRLMVSLDSAKMTRGFYRVQLAVVSAVDLDLTQDTFYFGIGVTVPPTPTPPLPVIPQTNSNPLTSNPIIPALIGAAGTVFVGAAAMFIRTLRE